MNKKNPIPFLFWLLVIAYAVYAAVFIYQTIIEIDGEKYFTLFDDAMISMQYARNLAQGHGMVFNAGGERVEGVSNPLWTVYMAFFHLFPIPASKISLAIQVSGALFLIFNLFYVRKITDYFSSPYSLAGLAAVFLTAFYYPLSNWSLLGLEVSILTLICSLAVWMTLQALKDGKFSAWLYVLLGLSTLIRIDMLGLGALTWGFLTLVDARNRRKNLVWGFLILAAFMAGQTLLRYLYYGDLLPNTYYLKMTGSSLLLRLKRGVYVFAKFVWNFNIVLFLLPFVLLMFRRDKAVLYLFLAFGVQAAYSIYVGGDAWEHRGGPNRFIAIVMPVYMALFALAAEKLWRVLAERMAAETPALKPALRNTVFYGALAFFCALSLLNFNALLDTLSLQYAFLRKPSIYVTGQEKILRIGLFVRQITDEQATVLAVAAGGVPYFSERYTYDLLGKSDAVIAHLPMHYDPAEGLVDFRPGHNKWDYAHSIAALKPDVIPEVWAGTLEEAAPYLEDYTVIQMEEFKRWLPNGVMYVRSGSPHIKWELIQQYIAGP